MTENQIIKLGLEAHLLNYIDNETPRRYFVCGNADLEDVKDFARLVSEEQAKEIERLREALRDCHHVLHKLMAIVPGNDTAVDEMAKVMTKARAALGEGKE